MASSIEHEAYNTLHAIRHADAFNAWMFDTLRPFIKGRVLEAGSGIGNISAFLLESYNEVWLSDFNDDYRRMLGHKFSSLPACKGILRIDLASERFDEECAPFFKSFDTIVATNVIEHIRDDAQAIRNCRKLLKDGGQLVILVPAFRLLFNNLDRAFGHYRRYTKPRLLSLLNSQATVVHCRYFNCAGIAGWFFSGTILRKKTISPRDMRVFNALVPVFKVIDKLVLHQVGLSVIAVTR